LSGGHDYEVDALTSNLDAYIVTSNDDKFETVRSILGDQLSLDRIDIELPEIQSTDTSRVAEYKAIEAYQRLNSPVIVDDFGLYMDGLGDFPGPLVKHLIVETGVDGLQMLYQASDGTGRMACSVAFFDGNRLRLFEGELMGTFDFDKADPAADMLVSTIFVPSGYEKVIGELDIRNHRAIAYEQLSDAFIDGRFGSSDE